MAYCKTCGNVIPEDNIICPVCGTEVIQPRLIADTADKPVYSTKKLSKFQRFLRKINDEDVIDETFKVFDTRVMVANICLMAMFAFLIVLSLFGHGTVTDIFTIIEGVLLFIGVTLVVVGCAIKNRGCIFFSIIFELGFTLLTALVGLARFGGGTMAENFGGAMEILLMFMLSAILAVMLIEMLCERRLLKLHMAFTVLYAVFVLFYIIFYFVAESSKQGDTTAAFIVMANLFSHIAACAVVIFRFFNLYALGNELCY